MARPSGAKNKPKSINELVKMLEDAAEKEGKKFVFDLVDKAPVSDEDKAKIKNELKQKFGSLEIDLEPDEVDTYKCGACGATMASELEKCPECGAKLNW